MEYISVFYKPTNQTKGKISILAFPKLESKNQRTFQVKRKLKISPQIAKAHQGTENQHKSISKDKIQECSRTKETLQHQDKCQNLKMTTDAIMYPFKLL